MSSDTIHEPTLRLVPACIRDRVGCPRVLLLSVVVLLGGLRASDAAYSSITASQNPVILCFNHERDGGELRPSPDNHHCASGETSISLNRSGPRGPAGSSDSALSKALYGAIGGVIVFVLGQAALVYRTRREFEASALLVLYELNHNLTSIDLVWPVPRPPGFAPPLEREIFHSDFDAVKMMVVPFLPQALGRRLTRVYRAMRTGTDLYDPNSSGHWRRIAGEIKQVQTELPRFIWPVFLHPWRRFARAQQG